jgi:hypothetical protein
MSARLLLFLAESERSQPNRSEGFPEYTRCFAGLSMTETSQFAESGATDYPLALSVPAAHPQPSSVNWRSK